MAETIYLAGGCFWGTESYLKNIRGVTETEVGFANGKTKNPSYEDVCYKSTGHAETVRVVYDKKILSLEKLLRIFFAAIDPTSVNRQGNDAGEQYRTGIYFVNANDEKIIKNEIEILQKSYEKKIAIEVRSLENFYPAEEYHQNYLKKNPNGYCHIPRKLFDFAKHANENHANEKGSPHSKKFFKPSDDVLRKKLSTLQYEVTQHAATEAPFANEYDGEFRKGIYTDIVTGEPLFLSSDKFDSGCGWPAFSKPIDKNALSEICDTSHGMIRTEVKSKIGGTHLGHVFNDGPKSAGGLRFCINSASLRFIPFDEMEKSGYGEWMKLLRD